MPRPFPVARELRWLFVLPQLAVLAVMILFASLVVGVPDGLVWGAGLYLGYSLGSRAILTHHHRKGMRHIHGREWENALAEFERSQKFLERHPWIDRYRQVVLMSPSGASYHEMALVNQAVCLIHLDRGAEARRLYERIVELHPDSPFAEAALRAMDSAPPSQDVAG